MMSTSCQCKKVEKQRGGGGTEFLGGTSAVHPLTNCGLFYLWSSVKLCGCTLSGAPPQTTPTTECRGARTCRRKRERKGRRTDGCWLCLTAVR